MRVGAILPHLLQYGGVQRFLEIGNIMVNRRIDYTIFSRKGQHCNWFDYHGPIQNWSKIEADCILVGDPPSFRILRNLRARIYIYVIAGGRFIPIYQTVYGKYPFILNNRIFRRYFPKASLAEGGVNIHRFVPKKKTVTAKKKVRVLYYSSARGIKGTKHIAHSLRGIPGVQLIGLSGLKGKSLTEAYHAGDFFVAWESREGLSNMSMEALASGLTVVTNGVNCEPFRNKVIITRDLRKFFLNPNNRKIRKRSSMGKFSWEIVVDKLLEIFARPYRVH